MWIVTTMRRGEDRSQHGAKWSRTASATLTTSFKTNLTKYQTILENEVTTDGLVGEKMMSGGEVSLLSFIHSSGGSREEALKSITSGLDLTYRNFQG